jgi:FixJ family two-component response regulator
MSTEARPLPRLREIREARRKADSLLAERDRLIRQAVAEGSSERAIAVAAGLSRARVHEIAAR